MIAAEILGLLSRYVGANNDPYERLSLVCERLLKSSDDRAKDLVTFRVQPDENGLGHITLSRNYVSILGSYIQSQTDSSGIVSCWGLPLSVQSPWYDFVPGSWGIAYGPWPPGIVPINGFFTTFASWTDAVRIRFKFATSAEVGDKIIVRGVLNGEPVYSTDSQCNWIEGIEVPYTGVTVTTTLTIDREPYAILKPKTNGRVSMYTVDSDNVETLVAIYDPGETFPQWRRYRVLTCPRNSDNSITTTFTCVCKRAFVLITGPNDVVYPSNFGAISWGLKAMLKEDSDDGTRAAEYWQNAKDLLANESEDDAAYQDGSVQVQDDHGMGQMDDDAYAGTGMWWPYNGGF